MSANNGFGRTLASLIGVQVCLNGCMAGLRMGAPLLSLEQGYGPASVGMLLSLFAVVQLVLAIPAGRFADRHTLRLPIILCTTAMAGGAALAASWPAFPAMCVAALLCGGANGAAVITLQRHAGRLADGPVRLKQVFSWLAIAPSFANFVGPFLAGLVIDHYGFQASFAVMAVMALGAWLLVRQASDPPQETEQAQSRRGSSWDLLIDHRMRLLLLVNWLISSCWDVHTFVLPILGHERGLSASVIGSILGAFAIAATVIRLIMPSVAAFLREWAVLAGAMISTALIYAAYPLMQSAWGMAACSILLGFALGSVQPMVMSMLHQITPA